MLQAKKAVREILQSYKPWFKVQVDVQVTAFQYKSKTIYDQ